MEGPQLLFLHKYGLFVTTELPHGGSSCLFHRHALQFRMVAALRVPERRRPELVGQWGELTEFGSRSASPKQWRP